jgi:hypothetical protein
MLTHEHEEEKGIFEILGSQNWKQSTWFECSNRSTGRSTGFLQTILKNFNVCLKGVGYHPTHLSSCYN